MHTELLINGKFEAGQGPGERVGNPRDGQLIVEVPEASDAQINMAMAAAAGAFDAWSRTTPAERGAALLKIADVIERDAETYADLESLNCGKPRHLVLADEITAI